MANIKNVVTEIFDVDANNIPESILDGGKPIIFRGLVNNWEFVNKARLGAQEAASYLKSFYNGRPSLITKGHDGIGGRYFYNSEFTGLNFDSVKMRIDDALDLIIKSAEDASEPSIYLSSNGLDSHFPGFTQQNFLQPPRRKVSFPVHSVEAKIWIGTRSIATCHYDALDNIACVVAGKRRFTLFPPEQFSNLYFGPLDPTPGGQAISLVDFDNPDYEAYPLFKFAEEAGFVAELEPGDAIYIPSMWMHHVEGLHPFNILVNYWWTDAPTYTGSAMNVLLHALLSLRDKPDHEKKAWKHLFDYYVFNEPHQSVDHIPEAMRGILAPLDESKSRRLRAMLLEKLNR